MAEPRTYYRLETWLWIGYRTDYHSTHRLWVRCSWMDARKNGSVFSLSSILVCNRIHISWVLSACVCSRRNLTKPTIDGQSSYHQTLGAGVLGPCRPWESIYVANYYFTERGPGRWRYRSVFDEFHSWQISILCCLGSILYLVVYGGDVLGELFIVICLLGGVFLIGSR